MNVQKTKTTAIETLNVKTILDHLPALVKMATPALVFPAMVSQHYLFLDGNSILTQVQI